MDFSSRPQIGVVENPDLAESLTILGFGVTGGGDFRESALAVRQHPAGPGLPVIISNVSRPGLRGWVDRQLSSGARVVVLRTVPGGAIPAATGESVLLPASINDVLAHAGWGASKHPLGTETVAPDGSIPGLASFRAAESAQPVTAAGEASASVAPAPQLAPISVLDPAPDFEPEPPVATSRAKPTADIAPAPDVPGAAFEPARHSRHLSTADVDLSELAVLEPIPITDDDIPDWARAELGIPAPISAASVSNASYLPIAPPEADDLPDVEPDAEPALPPPHVDEISVPTTEQIISSAAIAPSFPVPPKIAVQQIPPQDSTKLTFEQLVAAAAADNAASFSSPVPGLTASGVPGISRPAAAVTAKTTPVQIGRVEKSEPRPTPGVEPASPAKLLIPPPELSPPPAMVTDTWAAAPRQAPTLIEVAPPASINSQSAPLVVGRTAASHGSGAKVVVSYAGKGGVGKSSIALLLAQSASAVGMRVVVIDMNRGQGDLRSYLRLDDPNLASVYTAAVTGRPQDAILSPAQLSAARHPSLPQVDFAAVLAPPHDLADPAIVTDKVYGGVIELLHRKVELVILDTQITEAHDTSGLIDRVVVPALLGGAWGIGIADMSKPGLENLLIRTKDFITRGVARSQLMLVVNKAPTFNSNDRAAVERAFGAYAAFIGAAGDDPDFATSMNAGAIDVKNSTLHPIIDAALLRVTGRAEFQPALSHKRGWGRRK